MSTQVKHFFDQATFTLTYVVFDKLTKDCVVIDSVLNYDQASSKTSFESVNELDEFIKSNDLKLHTILETHAHADHLTGAMELKKRYPNAKVAIGKNITLVQETFKGIFNLKDFNTDGIQFDILLEEGKSFHAGSLEIEVIYTPGHTPACSSYLVNENLFTGDALFMPDYGTGRCDFPMGSAQELYHSIHEKLYQLPDETKFYTGHDYQPNGRKLKFQSTIGESKTSNIQLKKSTSESEFITFREKRDSTLAAPKLLLPSIQVNIHGGRLPKEEDNGKSYLRIPIS
ncbi:MBL fold metallo-hydrolase [Bacteriovoracaceae bacterium]|nr:MBL fold metallo-hydrolase [Bacteriovoracaceae bacterium]